MKSILLSVIIFLSIMTSSGFQSDELLLDDEEFGLEGGRSPDPVGATRPVFPSPSARKRSSSDLDSKIQFTIEHAPSSHPQELSRHGSRRGRMVVWDKLLSNNLLEGCQNSSASSTTSTGIRDIWKKMTFIG